MNGGYSGTGYFGPNRARDSVFNCLAVDFVVTLQSPNPDIISMLAIDDVLDVETLNEDSLVAKYNNDIAGTIIFINSEDLINCIKIGNSYKARVVLIDRGRCDVRITRR